VTKTAAEVRIWPPGDVVFDGTLFVPRSLKPGEYLFRIGLLDPRAERLATELTIEGRQPDGWYDLGSIQVQQRWQPGVGTICFERVGEQNIETFS
jgi:hypothetical protein